LLNSLAGDTTMWEPQFAALSRDFRILAYDYRGHGQSQSTPGPYTMDLLVQDLRGLLARRNITRPHLVGLSLGGMIAMTAALQYPAEFDHLVVIAARADMPPAFVESWKQKVKEVHAGGAAAIAESTLARWFTPEFRAAHPDVMANVRRMISRTTAEGYAGCIDVINRFQFLEQMPGITRPSLFIVGAKDGASTPAVMLDMQQRVPNARCVVIPDAAHLPNIEQPQAVNAALLQFLRSDGKRPAQTRAG
jgi:3-oxoadipate enol-lactonase